MFDQMKKIMEMKKQADQIKRDLESSVVESTDVPGIKITIDGAQNFHSIQLDSAIINLEKIEDFQNNLLRSINKAIAKSQSMAAERMKKTMGLNMPGF